MKTVEVIIDQEGKVTVEAVGFKGGACSLATKAIEQALGAVSSDTKKPEFYQDEKQRVVT